MNEHIKTIPQFASEAEERAFWETHDSTEFLNGSQAHQAVFTHLKPSPPSLSSRFISTTR